MVATKSGNWKMREDLLLGVIFTLELLFLTPVMDAMLLSGFVLRKGEGGGIGGNFSVNTGEYIEDGRVGVVS